ncbi:MAG: hypothetical protein L6R35_001899 [Caloplaca aegaea]|nr:MAG: hypothetical protein L6R35_001899 [Caloplaca aegaea]
MSTLRTTPPTSDPRPTNHLNGFNGHSYYDPFFAAPPEDEELIQISSHTSPDPNLSSLLSSTPSQSSRDPSLAPEAQNQLHSQQALDHFSNEPHLLFTSPPHPSANNHVAESALLSPNAPYASDNGYDLSDHSGTPEFDNGFYLEDDFGFLPDQGNDLDLSQWVEPPAKPAPQPTDRDTHPSLAPNDADPQSAGTASLLSHLMSPALTDNPSPGSRDGKSSPTMEQYATRASHFDNRPASYTKSDERSQHSGQGRGHILQTPTLTSSSIDTSPERPTAPAVAHLSGPVFRIESYSRGDSPNRPAGQLGRSASKRSRSSSHLAVEHDEYSSEEEVREERHDSGATIIPGHVRTGRSMTLGRVGMDPQARLQTGDTEIPNLKEQAETQYIALRNADVEEWLALSDTGSDAGGNLSPPPRPRATGRRRAKSAGERTLTHENLMNLGNAPPSAADLHIPGPGLVIKEESGDEDWDMEDEDNDEKQGYSDDGLPETPPAVVGLEDSAGYFSEAPPRNQSTSPPPLYRAHPWQDPLYDSTNPGPGVKMQPETSNNAITRFLQRANDLETLSRAATWGTRRLSESDLEGLFHRFSFKETNEGKEKRDRRSSFFEAAAAKLLPKRNGSIRRRKESEADKQQPQGPSVADHKKTDSTGSRKESLVVPSPTRRPSLGKRPKSPKIDTGSAVAAMTGQIAAVGAGKSGPTTATGTPSPTGAWMNVMKRNRSRSELQPNRSSGNLADLWTKQGGPPMPTLAAPAASSPQDEKAMPTGDVANLDEDEEDDAIEDKGVTIDLSIRADPITPTMEGFRSNVRQLNPRLPHFLIERIAQEQLRRYKKLVEFKVKHAQALATGKCASGKHCLELGGEATYLPSKSSSREAADLSHTGFAVADIGQSDDDSNALAEGVVTPAQFPPGVPMPPVKRLPAEFECSLCFKVKKFHKPSDWSKHVHEDVQPFTCTFQSCTEPKSFKRKADWVRHENERHRQLEWWMCNMHDCNHRCYRKDNFVQHLVREHKLPEPKVKTSKTGKPAVRGPSIQKARAKGELDDSADELDQVWRLVDECRNETPKNPKDEACKFCGNVCNSWKKLTVHLAKHMEQISMPVLSIAKAKEVTPETVISPIEQRASQNTSNSPIGKGPFSQQPSIQSSIHPSMSSFGNMPRSHVGPMSDQLGSYVSMQSSLYDNAPLSQFQRNQPSTYPPPQQQPQNNFSSGRGTAYNVSSYNSYDSGGSPNQFVSINPAPGKNFQYPTQTSSPEALYGGMRPPPVSQPRNGSFMSPHHNPYSLSASYSQQGQFAAVSDNYGYHNAGQSASLSSFSRSQPPQSMGAQAPVRYGQIEDSSFAQAPPGVGGVYGQQGQGYGY